ncbi:MAG: Na+/H+ antiporter subunit E [Anaerolineae bacterium]|nr:Na+/H+ antiporter subunit E [Anaerolineae bacterium]
MIVTALLAIPFAIVWMILTATLSVGSFLVGFLVGFAILFSLKLNTIHVNGRRLPSQLLAFVVYSVTLARDIWICSVDVAKRVLNPAMPMNPGIIAVRTQDPDEGDFTAAFSAHGITITPGELVVDFDGSHTMFVHCLDVEASSQNADAAQMKRLKLLRRMIGKD